jgi:hypothetical protein
MDHLGIFDRQGRGRNPPDIRVVSEDAGMRTPDRERGDRSYQTGHGPDPRCRRGAFDPVPDRLPVGGKRHIEQHNLAPGIRRPGLQVLEAGYYDHRRGDSRSRGGHAPAQPQHRQAHSPGPDHCERLGAADPVGDDDRLTPHIGEPIRFHLLQDPVDRGFQAARPAQAMAKGVHQLPEPLMGRTVTSCGLDQAIRGRLERSYEAIALGSTRQRSAW